MINTEEFLESRFVTVGGIGKSETKKGVIVGVSVDEENNQRRLTLDLEIDSKNKTYRPNMESIQNFTDKWGDNAEEWSGRVIGFAIEIRKGRQAIIGRSKDSMPLKTAQATVIDKTSDAAKTEKDDKEEEAIPEE